TSEPARSTPARPYVTCCSDPQPPRHHPRYRLRRPHLNPLRTPPPAPEAALARPPPRPRREELVAHPDRVRAALDAGAERASTLAHRTMDEVRRRLGLR